MAAIFPNENKTNISKECSTTGRTEITWGSYVHNIRYIHDTVVLYVL